MGKHYEIIDIDALDRVDNQNENSVEQRYYCPVCPLFSEKHTEDVQGKLYWNTEKHIGFCFRCNTRFFPKDTTTGFFQNHESIRDQSIIDLVAQMSTSSYYERFAIEKQTNFLTDVQQMSVNFTFPDLDSSLIEYLIKRNKYILPLTELLQCRGWFGTEVGVVFPFKYAGAVRKFQVRFLNTNREGGKYYTSPGQKLLYSPLHIFEDWGIHPLCPQQEITLCEGIFDAIALQCMNYPCVLAVLGKTLTPLHEHLIRLLVPEKIHLAFDTWNISEDLKKDHRQTFPSVSEWWIHNEWEKYQKDADPEDYLREHYKNMEGV